MGTLITDIIPKGLVFSECPQCKSNVFLTDYDKKTGCGGICGCGLYVLVEKYNIPNYNMVVNFMSLNDSDKASKLFEVGMMQKENKNFSLAITILEETINMAKRSDRLSLIASAFGNIGLIMMYQGNYKMAISNLKHAVDTDRSYNDEEGLGIDLYNLSTALFADGKTEEAILNAEKALEIQKKLRQWGRVEADLIFLIQIYQLLENKTQAEYYLDFGREIFNELGDTGAFKRLEGIFELKWVKKDYISKKNDNSLFDAIEKAKQTKSIVNIENAREKIIEKVDRLQQPDELIAVRNDFLRFSIDVGNEKFTNNEVDDATRIWSSSLSVADYFKSHKTSTLRNLYGKIGDYKRHAWPELTPPLFFNSNQNENMFSLRAKTRRECIKCKGISALQYFKEVTPEIKMETPHAKSPDYPNTEKFCSLHYNFIGNDLAIFIETDITTFLYGDKFTDFAYTPEKVYKSKSILQPILVKGIKKQLIHLLRDFYDRIQVEDISPVDYNVWIRSISDILHIEETMEKIKRSVQKKQFELDSILLLIFPDSILHRIPFSMLRCSNNQPLYTMVSSITTSLNLISFKWHIMKYIWGCRPFLNRKNFRIVFFGVGNSNFTYGQNYLEMVPKEWEVLQKNFSANMSLGFGDAMAKHGIADSDHFATYHQDGDVIWFAGHGVEEFQKSVSSPLSDSPKQGIALVDKIITDELFQMGAPWNFSYNYLLVLNACLLGSLHEQGTEVSGLMNSLSMIGVNAAVSSLWPINDKIAYEFADEFSKQLVDTIKNVQDKDIDWIRGKTFIKTIRKLSLVHDETFISPYCYFGVP